QGELMISVDGRYAVKSASMTLNEKTNISWVNNLTMDLSYSPNADVVMLQDSARVLVTLGLGDRHTLFGERMSYNSAYDLQYQMPPNIYQVVPLAYRTDTTLDFDT